MLARVEMIHEKTEEQDFNREVGIKSWRDDLDEEEVRSLSTSAGVHGGKDDNAELLNGVSGDGIGELRERSLVRIVALMVLILEWKKSEKVQHSFWFSTSVLVSSRSDE